MTLPFGTRVSRINDPSRIGVIVGIGVRGLAGVQPYTVAWEGQRPMARQTWEFGDGLTVVDSAAESALREIGRMLDLSPDADPAAIVEALRSCVADPYTGPAAIRLADEGRIIGRLTREDPPAPAEETVWGEP